MRSAHVEMEILATEIEKNWGKSPKLLPPQRSGRGHKHQLGSQETAGCNSGLDEHTEGGSLAVADLGSGQTIIRLKLDRDFKSYSLRELNELVEVLRNALERSNVVPVGKREGCVEIGIRLSPAEAERLLWLARSGALEEFGIIDGELVPAEDQASFLGRSCPSPTKGLPPRFLDPSLPQNLKRWSFVLRTHLLQSRLRPL
jgi:hypothetical protein